jgi:hypothetical protein
MGCRLRARLFRFLFRVHVHVQHEQRVGLVVVLVHVSWLVWPRFHSRCRCHCRWGFLWAASSMVIWTGMVIWAATSMVTWTGMEKWTESEIWKVSGRVGPSPSPDLFQAHARVPAPDPVLFPVPCPNLCPDHGPCPVPDLFRDLCLAPLVVEWVQAEQAVQGVQAAEPKEQEVLLQGVRR